MTSLIGNWGVVGGGVQAREVSDSASTSDVTRLIVHEVDGQKRWEEEEEEANQKNVSGGGGVPFT